MRSRNNIALLASLASIAFGAVGVSTASASPAWKFNGTELVGTETVLGTAISSSLSIPGATTRCGHTLLFMKISNTAGVGKGEVTKLPQFECTAGPTCTVERIEAEKFPWPVHVETVAGKNYVVIEKIRIEIVYAGELCAFAGVPIILKGTAGGLFENATSTLTFNGTTFKATGASLKVGATSVEWGAVFPMEALGAHSGEALEVG